jgi:hypothetical protein
MRVVVFMLLAVACGRSKPASDPQGSATPGPAEGNLAVPRDEGSEAIRSRGGSHDAVSQAPGQDLCALTDAAKQHAQDRAFQLKPEEGALTVGTMESARGIATTTEIKLIPASGFKVAKQIPIKLLLEQPSGVTLDKACMRAGGRYEAQGDAAALSDHELRFVVGATVDVAGPHEIKGVFSFGVCRDSACYSRMQPITIQVAAK